MTRTMLVSGMVAGDPHQGGATWAVLQWVLGLRRLGHRVVLVEPVAETKLGGRSLGESVVASYFREVAAGFDLAPDAALLLAGSRTTVGMTYDALTAAAAEADLLVNVAGMLEDPELVRRPKVRAYLDVDPAFTQLWHAAEGIDMRLAGHDLFWTVGLALGSEGCSLPTCGVQWQPVVPIVDLPAWPWSEEPGARFTTVGNWRGYGSIHHNGVHYGQRVHSMRVLADLPTRVSPCCSVALSLHPGDDADRRLLVANGWELLDPVEVAGTPERYQAFVGSSAAEIGIAKSGYVVSRSGWFSDRTVCYLASGRPAVVQDTGFGGHLPVGEGLLTYRSVDDAARAVAEVTADYEAHRVAARRLAELHCDASTVLPELLDLLM